MRAYHASISFAAEQPNRENGTSIQFLATDDHDAAIDVRRWYACRHENWPEYFRELYCIKLYHLNLGPIGPTGTMDPPTGMCVFEWKCDTAGMPYEDYVEYRLGPPPATAPLTERPSRRAGYTDPSLDLPEE